MRHEPSEQIAPPPYDEAAAEARCLAEAKTLIGADCCKALVEVRRLDAEAQRAYKTEAEIEDSIIAACSPDRSDFDLVAARWPGRDDATIAADEAGERFLYTLLYALRLPIRTVFDLPAKARLAVEFDYYADDFDIAATIARQIADHLEPKLDPPYDYVGMEIIRDMHRPMVDVPVVHFAGGGLQ